MNKSIITVALVATAVSSFAYQSPEILLALGANGIVDRYDPYTHTSLGTMYVPTNTTNLAIDGNNVAALHFLGGNYVVTEYSISTGVKQFDTVLSSLHLWSSNGFTALGNDTFGIGASDDYDIYQNGTKINSLNLPPNNGYYAAYRNGTLDVSTTSFNSGSGNVESTINQFSISSAGASYVNSISTPAMQVEGLSINGDGTVDTVNFSDKTLAYTLYNYDLSSGRVSNGDSLSSTVTPYLLRAGHNDTFYFDEVNNNDGSGQIIQGESPYGKNPGINNPTGFAYTSSFGFQDFVVYAAPEPKDALLLGLVTLGVLVRRRRS